VHIWQTFLRTYRTEPGGVDSRRIPQLDTLRGVAVLLIFYVHYYALMESWLAPEGASAKVARIVEGIAHCGTDLFFTLSGYLIYSSLMSRDRPVGPYIARRFARIYPTFLFVVGVYLVIFFFDPADSKLPPHVVPAILYVLANLALLPGLFEIEPIVTPAWSLSFLAAFYISAPLLVRGLGLRHWRRSHRALLLVSLATVFFAWGYFYGGPVRLAMFVSGMMLYEYRPQSLRLAGARVGAALFAATAAILAAITALGIPAVFRFMSLFALFPLATAACLKASTERGPLSWQWLGYLGRITLSYIMIHGLTLQILRYALRHGLPTSWQGTTLFWALMLPAFVATAISAAFVYTLVEDRG
jgi:exopolysaccharide production protein ExoZ